MQSAAAGAAPRAPRLLARPAASRMHPQRRKAAAPRAQVRSAAALAAGRCAAAFPAEAAPWRPELWPLLRGLLDENVPSVREDGAAALADAARAWGPALLDLLLPALRCARPPRRQLLRCLFYRLPMCEWTAFSIGLPRAALFVLAAGAREAWRAWLAPACRPAPGPRDSSRRGVDARALAYVAVQHRLCTAVLA